MIEQLLAEIRIAKYRMSIARSEEKYQLALDDVLDLTQELNLYT